MSSSSFGVVGKVHTPDNGDSPSPSRKGRVQWIWWVVALLLVFALYQFSSAGWIYAAARPATWAGSGCATRRPGHW